jgi:hypothetical protein
VLGAGASLSFGAAQRRWRHGSSSEITARLSFTVGALVGVHPLPGHLLLSAVQQQILEM